MIHRSWAYQEGSNYPCDSWENTNGCCSPQPTEKPWVWTCIVPLIQSLPAEYTCWNPCSVQFSNQLWRQPEVSREGKGDISTLVKGCFLPFQLQANWVLGFLPVFFAQMVHKLPENLITSIIKEFLRFQPRVYQTLSSRDPKSHVWTGPNKWGCLKSLPMIPILTNSKTNVLGIPVPLSEGTPSWPNHRPSFETIRRGGMHQPVESTPDRSRSPCTYTHVRL